MKKILIIGLLSGFVGSVYADGEALMRSHGCMFCHQVARKVVGPAFKDIAKVYTIERSAKARFTQVIQLGSKNKWGMIPMPPQNRVSDKDINVMFDWIVSQK